MSKQVSYFRPKNGYDKIWYPSSPESLIDRYTFLINEYLKEYPNNKEIDYLYHLRDDYYPKLKKDLKIQIDKFSKILNKVNSYDNKEIEILSKANKSKLKFYKIAYDTAKQSSMSINRAFSFIDNKIKEVESKKSKPKGKAGRKPSEVKEAKDYLTNINKPDTEENFILFLQKNYENPTPKTFAHLMYALNELGFINIDNKKAYKESFEKILSNKKIGAQSNFNRTLQGTDTSIVTSIKETIKKRHDNF